MIKFDEDAARRTEAIYSTPDVINQRAWTRAALSLQRGERVVDIGSGPGFLAVEMAEDVSPSGRISGVDVSQSMLAIATERSTRLGLGEYVSFQEGEAVALPFESEHFDVAVSTQVYEYVSDVNIALKEAHRILGPLGRLLIVDTDWDSIVWHGADRLLSARILAAWEEHLAHAHLPGMLSRMLVSAGFSLRLCDVYSVLNPRFDENTYSYGLIGLIKSFVVGRQGITEPEVEFWSEQLRRAGDAGDYFFSLNRYLFLAAKSGA